MGTDVFVLLVFFFVEGVGVACVPCSLRASTVGLCCLVALELEALGFWGSGFKEA